MDQQFLPSCINVIDESMMEWFNKWDPGFMFVGRKPHPFGNDWHAIFLRSPLHSVESTDCGGQGQVNSTWSE